MEVEANQFAAELLMPADMVRDWIEDIVDWIDVDDDFLENLSSDFEVSTIAMSIRL